MISLVFDMSIKTKIVSIHPYMIYFYVYGYAFSLFISLVTGWLVGWLVLRHVKPCWVILC